MKRIISLILLSVLMLITCSCEVASPTVEPTSATTEALSSTPTVLPSTPPLLTTTTTPSAEPTKTPTMLEQIFSSTGVFNESKKIAGNLFGLPFSTLPYEDNGIYCSCAFFNFDYVLTNEGSDKYSENIGAENCEYSFFIYYKETEGQSEFKGPYTLVPRLAVHYVYWEPNSMVYEFSLGDSPEGIWAYDLEVGKEYTFIVCFVKDNIVDGYSTDSCVWTDRYDRSLELYRRFWENRDRSEGILSGMHPDTEKDIQDRRELGFEIQNGPWMG